MHSYFFGLSETRGFVDFPANVNHCRLKANAGFFPYALLKVRMTALLDVYLPL
jgi:hypothetical protein